MVCVCVFLCMFVRVHTGGVGFDINCGVRLLRTNLFEKDIQPIKEQLAQVRACKLLLPLGYKSSQGAKKLCLARGTQEVFLKKVIRFNVSLFTQSLFDHIPVGVGSKGVIPMAAK